MSLLFALLGIVDLMIWAIQQIVRSRETKDKKLNNVHRVRQLGSMKACNAVAFSLSRLVDEDGAGDWPPRVAHHDLPFCFQPYHDTYLELVPHLSTATPSLDDTANKERMANFRFSMRELLTRRINISEVESALAKVESGDYSYLSRETYNAIYCCIAVCRHAYRWATIPVVKQAQLETTIDFPPELDVPWPYLQRHFGLMADSGNNTANVLLNFDENGDRVYKINVGMSDLIRSSEEVFFRMFFDVEVLAFPIYYEMVSAIVRFEDGHKGACLKHLQNVTWRLRDLLLIFYNNLKESRISQSVWLSYVQGFQGWGVGRMIDGEFVKYDGLSGNHVLFFQAVDAFLGLDRYLTDENMDRYIPVNQRNLCLALKKHSIRQKLHGADDIPIRNEITKIVNHMKVFRSAHKTRVKSYLEHPAPERLIMTAGKSVLENQDTKGFADAYRTLDELMATRLRLTV